MLNRFRFDLVVAFLAALYLGAAFMPASFWFSMQDPTTSKIEYEEGETVELIIVRTIHRDFYARWFVDIRRYNPDGSNFTEFVGNGAHHYKTESSLPDPVTLDWWAGPPFKSSMLPPGTYRFEQCHFIDTRIPLIPEKKVCRMSNFFRVGPNGTHK